MLAKAVEKYINNKDIHFPFFIFIDGKYYSSAKESFPQVRTLLISDYCQNADSIPDFDFLIEDLKTAEGTILLLGLGEYLALQGNSEAYKTLLRLKNLSLSQTKVLILLRGLSKQVVRELETDQRFDSRYYYLSTDFDHSLIPPLTQTKKPTVNSIQGLKSLLTYFESDTLKESRTFSSEIVFNNSLVPIKIVGDYYDMILLILPSFSVIRDAGQEREWEQLLNELTASQGDIEQVFKDAQFNINIENYLNYYLKRNDYIAWLYFIALKHKQSSIQNSYLRYVLETTNKREQLKDNILNGIIDIPLNAKEFKAFYRERKKLLTYFNEADFSGFIRENEKHSEESIHRLTDTSETERKAIIRWIAKHGLIECQDIYPDLANYLTPYQFYKNDVSEKLSLYFEQYKQQKVCNILDSAFLSQVDILAQKRTVYTHLPPRASLMEKFNQEKCYLIWVDALGVEYLAYIVSLAEELDLFVNIQIASANLPTITSMNKEFYEAWQGEKEKISQLDEVKHKELGQYNHEKEKCPVHLVSELDILRNTLQNASSILHQKKFVHVLIVSDHGASRLAVLHGKEEPYEVEEKGKHSGRCCKELIDATLPFATNENGYTVLADYGRFKGSRVANVEVHGGGSLEEVVIPIIELTLKKPISLQLINDADILLSREHGFELKLFCDSIQKNLFLDIEGVRYKAIMEDAMHYKIPVIHIKKVGTYKARIFIEDTFVQEVEFTVSSKTGKLNKDFDFF